MFKKNETRQKLFLKLSGELQRRIGLTARDMGANCVLGYVQMFDLEGERGIVVRGNIFYSVFFTLYPEL